MIPDNIELTDHASPNNEGDPDTAMEMVQNSALLGLPLEVFQTITRHMDAGTFFASLLVCKHFLKAARCRPNIVRHLCNLPGLRLGLGDISTSDLLLQFRKRAAESGCAAGVLADVNKYQQTSRISLSNAAFSLANPSQPGSQAHIATVHDGGIIQIYDLGQHHVRLKTELHIRPEDGDPRRMEIVKMAFAPRSRDLAVLYQHVPRSSKPGVKREVSAHDPSGKRGYKLVTFHYLSAMTKGYFYDSHQQETRDIKVSDVEVPVGLALAGNGYVCIAWKNQILQHTTNVTLVGRDEKLLEACNYDSNPQILRIQDPAGLPSYLYKDRQIFGVHFVDNDKKMNFHQPGSAVHCWYTNSTCPSQEECGPLLANFAFIDIGTEEAMVNTEFQVGMPFHATHSENVTVDWQPAPHCQTSYLALGISCYVNQCSNHPNAFIVQADCEVSAGVCTHEVHLDHGRTLTSWKAVALLAGWRKGASSLGTIVTISPKGTKVAAATWSRILVWSLNPKLLHQGELQLYFPVRDYNQGKEFGRLRPTLLTSGGVVHNMLWIDEARLFATTDQGLMKWDIGPKSNGEREDLTLMYDAWPETAVAVPAVPCKD